ncbi:MAG: hypothetical protein LBL26_11470 [Peptococcaceae bacterium]|jgi:hypothetical protein|nr:hypothetical protein [Peptococcaceae bacterium]
MSKSKRCFAFLLSAACFLLILPAAARADTLEVPDNDFFYRHSRECTTVNRSFLVNGGDGFLTLKEEPGSARETAVISNGEVLRIVVIYRHKGDVWGLTEIELPDEPYHKWPKGWVPMNQLLLLYDFISFAEEHEDEFYPYTGGGETLEAAAEIVLWSWPGSGEARDVIEMTAGTEFNIAHAYMDAQGREWGFVDFWRGGSRYGRGNEWICISDPANGGIPAFNPPPQPALWQLEAADTPGGGSSAPLLIIVLVAVLVLGTAVLIRIFWRPKGGFNP